MAQVPPKKIEAQTPNEVEGVTIYFFLKDNVKFVLVNFLL